MRSKTPTKLLAASALATLLLAGCGESDEKMSRTDTLPADTSRAEGTAPDRQVTGLPNENAPATAGRPVPRSGGATPTAELFRSLDKDGNGLISKQEAESLPADTRIDFAALDTNQDGKLSPSELQGLAGTAGSAGPMGEPDKSGPADPAGPHGAAPGSGSADRN